MIEQIYNILLSFLFVMSPVILLSLLFLKAPYGKFSNSRWGFRIRSRTAWIIMELPAVVTVALCFFIFSKSGEWKWVFLIIWEFHYLYRTFIFPLKMKKGASTFPIGILASAIFFNIVNGFLNGVSLFFIKIITVDCFTKPHFIIGLIFFLFGFILHYQSDRLILKQKPGPGEYIIPQGGFFRWISCPNYLGEIIQWFGWALLTYSLAGLAFALFTFCNIFPRALATHKWYHEKFKEYQNKKKAVIPKII